MQFYKLSRRVTVITQTVHNFSGNLLSIMLMYIKNEYLFSFMQLHGKLTQIQRQLLRRHASTVTTLRNQEISFFFFSKFLFSRVNLSLLSMKLPKTTSLKLIFTNEKMLKSCLNPTHLESEEWGSKRILTTQYSV